MEKKLQKSGLIPSNTESAADWQRKEQTMQVSDYQIHNVLKDYSRQLILRRISEQNGSAVSRSGISDAKRQAVIEKISESIILKLARIDSDGEHSSGSPEPQRKTAEDHKESLFFYNVIDPDNQKKTCSLSVEDPVFLMKKFD
ncbi:MAG: hypothetical protein BWK80_63490, partial [Desulfobacteraceae bacterium IS3]